MATELPDRPTDQDLQAVCRSRIDVLIDCSASQVGGVTRPADNCFATRRCLTIEPVAHMQSSEYPQRRFDLRSAWADRWTCVERREGAWEQEVDVR
eukprot:7391781-Prymnesium_polylepis.1